MPASEDKKKLSKALKDVFTKPQTAARLCDDCKRRAGYKSLRLWIAKKRAAGLSYEKISRA